MRRGFLRFSEFCDRVALAVCALAALMLVATVLTVVVLRYGFATGFIRLQDLANYAFAVLLVFAVPVCMARNGHVRVEIVSEKMPRRYIVWADALALVFFLIPVFGLAIWAYMPELAYSWSIREGSVETGGLAGLYLVKTALPIAAALMIVQGVAMVLRPHRPSEAIE